jgi:hypothetical protein
MSLQLVVATWVTFAFSLGGLILGCRAQRESGKKPIPTEANGFWNPHFVGIIASGFVLPPLWLILGWSGLVQTVSAVFGPDPVLPALFIPAFVAHHYLAILHGKSLCRSALYAWVTR